MTFSEKRCIEISVQFSSVQFIDSMPQLK